MCTVTWLPKRDGYELRMNRDELRTRAVALPPAVYERNGVRYIAPRDVDGGGTWIAVNDAGLAVCLLNGPAPSGGHSGVRSRGLLVDELADARSIVEVRVRLGRTILADYSAFTLLVLEPGTAAFVARWNGATLDSGLAAEALPMLTSSSVDLDAVTVSRTEVYRDVMKTSRGHAAEALEQFHREHLPLRGHRSVCMHRDDAATVSYSRVAVCRDAALMHYEDGPACSGLRFDPIALSRRSAVAASRPLTGAR